MTRAARDVRIVAFVLALLVALTQWGSFGQEVLDWDESTFILVADRLADGHLPYLDLYDNKPPLIFAMLAGVIVLFGDSLVAIRIFGDLCILASALMVYAIARRLTDPVAALGAAVLTVLVHGLDFGQHTSTELPATAMILGATWCLLFRRDRLWGIALAALLISLATLTRSNLGLIAVVFGVYLAVAGVETSSGRRRRLAPLAVYTLAGLTPPAIVVAIYAWQGGLDAFWVSVVTVPLNYASEQVGPLVALQRQALHWGRLLRPHPVLVGGYSLLALAGLCVAVAGMRRGRDVAERRILLIMVAATMLSVLQSGEAFTHYLIQVLPFGALAAAFALRALAERPRLQGAGLALIGLMAVLSVARLGPDAFRNVAEPGALAAQLDLRDAAAAIDAVRAPQDRVWALGQHLILWYLDVTPIVTVAAHPDNIVKSQILDPLREAGFAPEDPLGVAYGMRPAFIVHDPAEWALSYLPDRAAFDAYLAAHYAPFFRNDGAVVYRRLGHRGWDGAALQDGAALR